VPWFRRDGLGWRRSWATPPTAVWNLACPERSFVRVRRPCVGSHDGRCAGRIFCGTVPRVLATDAPAHHPRQSLGLLQVIRLRGSPRTTLRTLEPGAPFTAGSRCSEEQRAATTGLARGHRSLPTCFSRAALRARYASASRPDAPHAAHRLLSIERARSTPRTTTNPDGDTGQCCRQAIDQIDRPVHALRGVEHPDGHNTPASATARRGGFTPNGSWSGHPMSPGNARSRWKNDPGGGAVRLWLKSPPAS
jgi:hypothetical protein